MKHNIIYILSISVIYLLKDFTTKNTQKQNNKIINRITSDVLPPSCRRPHHVQESSQKYKNRTTIKLKNNKSVKRVMSLFFHGHNYKQFYKLKICSRQMRSKLEIFS